MRPEIQETSTQSGVAYKARAVNKEKLAEACTFMKLATPHKTINFVAAQIQVSLQRPAERKHFGAVQDPKLTWFCKPPVS